LVCQLKLEFEDFVQCEHELNYGDDARRALNTLASTEDAVEAVPSTLG